MQVVIIGNGVAGATVARRVAEQGASVHVGLYTKERYPYYPRPRLIDYLAGKLRLEDLPQYDITWYQSRGIDLQMGQAVTQLDAAAKRITLENGQEVPFDALVLATGAQPWVPPIEGADKEGIYTLRTVNDAIALKKAAESGRAFIVLGGGLLGLDAAMALHAAGAEVTVIEALPWLLPRQLDREGAALLQRSLESRGVRVITGDSCARIEGDTSVKAVTLQSGQRLEAGALLVAAGVRTKTALARSAGLACQRGIVVNERMETNAPWIYAVGDAAEFNGTTWAIIPAALAQARVAAAQILGERDVLYQEIVPSTTLQVTGIDLSSIGEVHPKEGTYQEVRYQDDAACIYKKLVIRQGRVVGAILLGDRSLAPIVTQLIAQRIDVSSVQDRLLAPDFDLGAWVRERVAQR